MEKALPQPIQALVKNIDEKVAIIVGEKGFAASHFIVKIKNRFAYLQIFTGDLDLSHWEVADTVKELLWFIPYDERMAFEDMLRTGRQQMRYTEVPHYEQELN